MYIKIIYTIVIVSLIGVFTWAVLIGLDKQDKVDCLTWENQAKELQGFFLTKAQDEQCRALGIIISTDIK